MRAGEEVEHGNAGGIERAVVRGAVAVAGEGAGEPFPLAGRRDDLLPLHRRLAAQHGDLVAPQPAHHVHVEHGDEIGRLQAGGGMAGEGGRAEHPFLLAGEGHQVDVAAQPAPLAGERARHLEQGGGAGGVVVRPVVDLVRVGSQRARAAVPQVVVVGADHQRAGEAAGGQALADG